MASGGHLRRLLYAQLNASDCHGACYDACEYSHLCPPPPSPSPLAPPAPDYDQSTVVSPPHVVLSRHHGSSLVPALPIGAASLLSGVLLLLAFYAHLLLRRRRRRRMVAAALAPTDNTSDAAPGSEEFFEDTEPDHHVWYIRTVGLDESTIATITSWAYKTDDGVLAGAAANCAVCLADFRDGEVLRLLPKCGHAFHVVCIDPWLRLHVNCPLCRAAVVATRNEIAAAGIGNRNIGPSSVSASSSSLSSSSVNSYQVNPNSNSITLVCPSPIAHRLSASTQLISGEVEEPERSEIGAQNGILIDTVPNHEQQMNEILLIQRSASAGSLQLSAFLSQLEQEEGHSEDRIGSDFEEGKAQKIRRKRGYGSRHSLAKEMERSLSSEGRRFFLSRHGRARSSILPL